MEAKDEVQIQLGPQVREGELVFGVAHIYASFNDTFVHITDLSGRETICRVTGGMKVRLIVTRPLPTPLCWPLRTSPRKSRPLELLLCTSSSAPPAATGPRLPDPCWHEDWTYRGLHPHPLRCYPQEGRTSWTQ